MITDKVTKYFEMGGNVRVKIVAKQGVAIMTSNYGKEMLKIYLKTKEKKKNVSFDYRSNAMIEVFDIPLADYMVNLEKDYGTAMIEQKKAMDVAQENMKK